MARHQESRKSLVLIVVSDFREDHASVFGTPILVGGFGGKRHAAHVEREVFVFMPEEGEHAEDTALVEEGCIASYQQV